MLGICKIKALAVLITVIFVTVAGVDAAYLCGDANGDGNVNIVDASFIVNYIFFGGPTPDPIENGDANNDGNCNIVDASYIINYIFFGGLGPCQDLYDLYPSCVDAVPHVEIINNGHDMTSPANYSVLFENSTTDNGSFQLLQGASADISLSNMHGTATLSIDGTDLSANTDNCLIGPVHDHMASIDINFSDESQPLMTSNGYDIYFSNYNYDQVDVSLTPTTDGMLLHAVYIDISADIFADCPCTMCTCWFLGGDGNGIFTIDSAVVNTSIVFNVTPQQTVEVTVHSTTVDLFGTDITMYNSWTNFLIEIIMPYFIDGFVADLENELQILFTTDLGPYLENILVP